MNFLSAKYNVAARYVNYIYEYRRMNASCTVKCHCRVVVGGEGWGGGGVEETRSGTEKRCSHNLKSGHPVWWSADNCLIFPTVKMFRSKKRTAVEIRHDQKIEKHNIIHPCFSCIS